MRLWRSAVVALALSPVVFAETAVAQTVRSRSCGVLRGTAVYAIRAEGLTCAAARRVAALHLRAVRSRGRGACRFDGSACRVQKYFCSAQLGLEPRPRDARIRCGDTRNTEHVALRYDARRIRLPPPPSEAGTSAASVRMPEATRG